MNTQFPRYGKRVKLCLHGIRAAVVARQGPQAGQNGLGLEKTFITAPVATQGRSLWVLAFYLAIAAGIFALGV